MASMTTTMGITEILLSGRARNLGPRARREGGKFSGERDMYGRAGRYRPGAARSVNDPTRSRASSGQRSRRVDGKAQAKEGGARGCADDQAWAVVGACHHAMGRSASGGASSASVHGAGGMPRAGACTEQ